MADAVNGVYCERELMTTTMECPAVASMLARLDASLDDAPDAVADAVAAPRRLEVSADRKTSPSVRVRKGKQDAWPNAFGIPGGPDGSCRDTTPFCKSCYATSTERQWSAVAAKLQRNYDALLSCGDDVDALAALLRAMLADWHADAVKRDIAREFRIHWDGDFYSVAYAQAWARVVAKFPDVRFWVYTRAAWAIPYLANIPNLAVYASVDAWNVDTWRPVLDTWPTVRVAACDDTFDNAGEILLKLDRGRAPSCPEGVKLPLVVGPSGRPSDVPKIGTTGNRGACNACGLCINGRSDVRFATTKKGKK